MASVVSLLHMEQSLLDPPFDSLPFDHVPMMDGRMDNIVGKKRKVLRKVAHGFVDIE